MQNTYITCNAPHCLYNPMSQLLERSLVFPLHFLYFHNPLERSLFNQIHLVSNSVDCLIQWFPICRVQSVCSCSVTQMVDERRQIVAFPAG